MAELSAQLMAALATSESGLSLIYKALDGLVEQFALRDAAVVIDEPGLSRQVFCAGRREMRVPAGKSDAVRSCFSCRVSGPGLLTLRVMTCQAKGAG